MSDAPKAPYADLERFDRLYAIIRHLRSPGGCAWDREQTPMSMRGSLVEEAYEIVDAVEAGDDANLREELGDLMLVALSIVRMREEAGAFGVDQVFDEVCAKLVRRHPHVFGGASAETAAAVLEQWDRIKWAEKAASGHTDTSALAGVPRGLPALERAHELQRKAAKVGFDWPEARPILDKLDEERRELADALGRMDAANLEEEIGDLLFTVVNLGRKLGVDTAGALSAANRKFETRFREMEKRIGERGGELPAMSLAEMDAVWDEVKES